LLEELLDIFRYLDLFNLFHAANIVNLRPRMCKRKLFPHSIVRTGTLFSKANQWKLNAVGIENAPYNIVTNPVQNQADDS
jgi:hypothetical protein